jgi:signal transduction histidine kinase
MASPSPGRGHGWKFNTRLTTSNGSIHTIVPVSETRRITEHRWPRPLDVAGALAVVGIVALGTRNIDGVTEDRAMDWLAYASGVTGAVSLAFWRRRSVLVTGIVAVATAVYVARGYTEGPALLPGPLALLALGYAAPRRVAWIGGAALVASTIVARWVAPDDFENWGFLAIVGWASAAVLAGQAIAARGERAAAQRERLAHQQEQAIAGERLRIAQDLHDSVAHAMATINVQSGVAAHLLDRDPSQARGALEAIRAASSHTLDELGAIVGVLRDPRTAAPRTPVSTLADVEALVVRSRADGLAVTADVRGTVESVAPSVSAAAYRVVQEALTNVRRHAGGVASAELDVVVGDGGAVRVSVRDDGRGSGVNGSTTGFGLIGMRERVEATGGLLQTGPRPGGGFEVVATWNGRP